MKQLPQDTFDRIDAAVVQEARVHTDLVRQFIADLQVQYPTAIGLLGGLVGTLLGFVVTGTYLTFTGPFLIAALLGLWVTVKRQSEKTAVLSAAHVSTTEVWLAYSQERDANKRLSAAQERQLQWLFAISVMMDRAIRFVADTKADPSNATLEAAQQACCEILDKLQEIRHVCLKYAPDDPTFNLHIFCFDAAQGHLSSFARRHGSGIKPNNRTWRPGIGHAGRCFEDGEMMCLSDLQGIEGQGYRNQPKANDTSLYRAVIDVPIRASATNWGVLCITSGTPDQFSKGDFAPLTVVAAIIGVIVAATGTEPVRIAAGQAEVTGNVASKPVQASRPSTGRTR